MAANTVLGVYNRDRLSDALAALHRDGYGPNVRVIDAARGALAGQLERAGVCDPPTFDNSAQLLVMVFAPARVGSVVDLLQHTGVETVHLVERPQTHDMSPLVRGLVQSPPRPTRRASAPLARPAGQRAVTDSEDRLSPSD